MVRDVGLEAAGFYSVAWALSGLYVELIFQAMGADFGPRLASVATDNTLINRLANEQAQVNLLLAGPGIIAKVTFAPLVIPLLYSNKFAEAVEILRWICLGMALRVITWPIGFIVVAKNRQLIQFGETFALNLVNVGLAWVCVGHFGLNGAGIAFFGSNLFRGLLVYSTARALSGFRWSAANRKTGAVFLCSIAFVFCSSYLLPPLWAAVLGGIATALSGLYSLHTLLNLLSTDRIPQRVRQWLTWLRLDRRGFASLLSAPHDQIVAGNTGPQERS